MRGNLKQYGELDISLRLKNKVGIFSRLMKLCIIIIVLCAFLMSGINILQAIRYSEKEKATELSKIAKLVNELVFYYNDDGNNINQIADYEDVIIVITDKEGYVKFVSKTEHEFPDRLDAEGYEKALDNQTTYRTGAFNKILKYSTFSVASPCVSGSRVEGVIFVIAKNEFFSPEVTRVITMNLISLGVATLVAILTSYFISRGLVKPLRRMEAGAREISLGRYNAIIYDSKIREYSELIGTFNKMSSELEKQDRARSDFIANISHDLRTPLTTIMGYVRGIMDDTIPAEMQNQYLGVVLSEGERMQHMIENNLDLSKYESGNFVPNMSNFNLNEIVRSIVITMEKRIREKNIIIDFKYEKSENIVEADESAIYRVIQNLLDNALKFASIGSEIQISIINKNGFAIFSIKNYGSSISAEEQKYIWDRYYKADGSRSYHKTGSGLGLYIVKSIINQHNQHIEIKSDDNSVEFTFTLNLTNC